MKKDYCIFATVLIIIITMLNNKFIYPIPEINPVIALRMLVDCFIFINYILPSITIGAINNIDQKKLILYPKIINIIPIICPINIPIHLAHI